jgi:hypothetical protein
MMNFNSRCMLKSIRSTRFESLFVLNLFRITRPHFGFFVLSVAIVSFCFSRVHEYLIPDVWECAEV